LRVCVCERERVYVRQKKGCEDALGCICPGMREQLFDRREHPPSRSCSTLPGSACEAQTWSPPGHITQNMSNFNLTLSLTYPKSYPNPILTLTYPSH